MDDVSRANVFCIVEMVLPASIRPLSVGEILDSALKILQRRFKSLMMAVAVVTIPMAIATTAIQLSTPQLEDLVVTDAAELESGEPSDLDPIRGEASDFAKFAAANGVILLVSIIAGQLAAGAALRVVTGAYLGEAPNWRASLNEAWAKLFRLVILALLSVVITLAMWLLIVPGIAVLATGGSLPFGVFLVVAGALGALVGTAIVTVRFSVAVPVLMIEDHGGVAALRRSNGLVQGRSWQTAAVLILAFLMTMIASSLVGAAVLAVQVFGSQTVRIVIGGVATLLASLITTPFNAAITVVLYFDLRVRREGLDLEILARSVGVDPAGDGADRTLPAMSPQPGQGFGPAVPPQPPWSTPPPPQPTSPPQPTTSPWSNPNPAPASSAGPGPRPFHTPPKPAPPTPRGPVRRSDGVSGSGPPPAVDPTPPIEGHEPPPAG